jgi:protein-S-isoprenylcysteine O-methyltransferase Ste14
MWTLASTPFLYYEPWLGISIAGWSSLYILRALTEERHILMVDRKTYEKYMEKCPIVLSRVLYKTKRSRTGPLCFI